MNLSCNAQCIDGLTLKDTIAASISRGNLVFGVTNDANGTSSVTMFANPFWTEVAVLSNRLMMNVKRMQKLVGVRLGVGW
uniref:Uncharacterized protein n=1 Tax=Nelumbo nucifera TaxID=4432 RepID=A0A822ZQH3_NELNU|nr:TPA_asm: hypothetical protein HUJ06_003406 [Nelumbo nucifera]